MGASWRPLGASWRPLGASSDPLGAENEILNFLVALLGPLGASSGPSWGPLGRLLGVLGPSRYVLGPSWGCLGGLPGCLGALFRASRAVLERRKSEKARKPKTSKNTMENQRFWPLGALLGGFFGASWGVLEASWAVLRPSWASSGPLEAFLAIFRARVACREQFGSGPGLSWRLWDPPKLPGGPHGGVRQRPGPPPSG